ncbi:MAG: hypothetical protein ACLSHO_10585 [Dysosmobacter sp.]
MGGPGGGYRHHRRKTVQGRVTVENGVTYVPLRLVGRPLAAR